MRREEKHSPSRDVRSRRREVEDRLERGGFPRAPIRAAPAWPDPGRDRRVLRLRGELESLGPVFSCLGRYLSTRIDLLPAEDYRTLGLIPDRAAPLSEPELRSRLRAELGESSDRYASLEGEPAASRLAWQTQSAQLGDGRFVTVRVARSDLFDGPDLELVPELAPRLSSIGWPLAPTERLLGEFRGVVERALDLRSTAAVLEDLGGSAAIHAYGAAPVVKGLSTRRVLTLEDPASPPLFPGPPPGLDPDPEERARTRAVGDLWIHLIFSMLHIPEELSPHDVRLARGRIVTLAGGVFWPITQREAAALFNYLEATARDQTEDVYQVLRGLWLPGRAAQPDGFRHTLDHLVTRRDGRFGEAPPGLPEMLLTHWRELERHGLSPNPPLSALYRGLVHLREVLGAALSHEVLREAIQVAQVTRAVGRLRATARPEEVLRSAEAWVEWLGELQRRAVRGWFSSREARPASREVREAPRDESWMSLVAGLLLLGSLWLWFERLPGLFGAWTAALEACALAATGLLILRSAWRS